MSKHKSKKIDITTIQCNMQNILRSFQQDLFAYHAGAIGKHRIPRSACSRGACSPPRREFEGSPMSSHSTQHRARLVHSMCKLVPPMVRYKKQQACVLHYQVDCTACEHVLRFWRLMASR